MPALQLKIFPWWTFVIAMHVKRLLIGSVLYLYIALCLGTDEIEVEVPGVGSYEIPKDQVDGTVNAGHLTGVEETIYTTNVDEEVGIVDETIIVDQEEGVEITETVDEKVEVGETDVVFDVEKNPVEVKEVVEKETTVVVDKEPKIDHRVISNGGTNDEFHGEEIVKKEEEVELRENFLDDPLKVRQSNLGVRQDVLKIFGNDNGHEIEQVTELEDEDRFGDGTLAQLLDEFLLDPLDAILELLKQTLRSVVANLDHILEKVFKVVASLLNVVLVLVLDILILVVHVLADLVPGVFGRPFNKYDGYVTECVEKVKMDPITTSLIELEQCVTDPLFHIVENVIIILTDVQEILGEVDQGLRQLEVVRKAEEALTDVVAIVLDVVERVLETVEDLVEGPVADILVILPVLLACILGDIGKNLLGGLLNLLKKYVACTTYTEIFDFDSVMKTFVFW